jgi:hypothetical protein
MLTSLGGATVLLYAVRSARADAVERAAHECECKNVYAVLQDTAVHSELVWLEVTIATRSLRVAEGAMSYGNVYGHFHMPCSRPRPFLYPKLHHCSTWPKLWTLGRSHGPRQLACPIDIISQAHDAPGSICHSARHVHKELSSDPRPASSYFPNTRLCNSLLPLGPL